MVLFYISFKFVSGFMLRGVLTLLTIVVLILEFVSSDRGKDLYIVRRETE